MAMTDSDVRKLQPQEKRYVISTGKGLIVEVHPNGSKYFIWQYQYPAIKTGKRKTYHIGKYGNGSDNTWTLKQARDEKDRLNVLRKQGQDPQLLKSEERKEATGVGTINFSDVANQWIGRKLPSLAKSSATEYRNMLNNEIIPKFGLRPIRNIRREEILDWHGFHEKRGKSSRARKLLMTMRQVFEYAKNQMEIPFPNNLNPARSDEFTQPTRKPKPLPSLTADWDEVRKLLIAISKNLVNAEFTTDIATKIMAFTFLRANSLVSAKWVDIDYENRMWITPDYDMKGRTGTGRDHLTPMSQPVIDLFKKLESVNGSQEYCFYSPRGRDNPYMNSSTVNKHIRKLGFGGKHTAHGFRAMATTYGQEKLGFAFEIIDLQLGHIKTKGDKIRQAYDRAQFIDERTLFMDKWADLLLENGLEV